LPASEINNEKIVIPDNEVSQLDISMQSDVSCADQNFSKNVLDESSKIQVIVLFLIMLLFNVISYLLKQNFPTI